MIRSMVSGRVLYRETIRAALLRHMKRTSARWPSRSCRSARSLHGGRILPLPVPHRFTDDRQHASRWPTSSPSPANARPPGRLELTWMTPEEVLSSDVQLEFSGGRGALIRQALAFAGVGH